MNAAIIKFTIFEIVNDFILFCVLNCFQEKKRFYVNTTCDYFTATTVTNV